jgi:hypothetical protein
MSHDDLAVVDEEDDISCVQPEHSLTRSPAFTDTQLLPPSATMSSKGSKIWHTIRHHFTRHAGAGIMASVAYFDPLVWRFLLPVHVETFYFLLSIEETGV